MLIIYFTKRIRKAFACALRPSASAKTAADSNNEPAHSRFKDTKFVHFIKSRTPRGEENLAEPPVGKT